MAPCHRLCHLKMGEPGHDHIGAGLGLCQQRTDQCRQCRIHRIKLIPNPKLEIRCHLIVARPTRVQTPGRFTDQILEARLHIHVDIFQRG